MGIRLQDPRFTVETNLRFAADGPGGAVGGDRPFCTQENTDGATSVEVVDCRRRSSMTLFLRRIVASATARRLGRPAGPVGVVAALPAALRPTTPVTGVAWPATPIASCARTATRVAAFSFRHLGPSPSKSNC